MLTSRTAIMLFFSACDLCSVSRADVPSPPSTDPYYYPYDVPKGKFPSYWPKQGGEIHNYQRATAVEYPNWPGLGYMAWSGFKDKAAGAPGGNVWGLKWGSLPNDYSYDSTKAVTVSHLDTIRVHLQTGYKFFRMSSLSDFQTCSFERAVEIGNFKASEMPTRVQHAFVEQSSYECKKTGVLNPWKCATASTPASEVDLHPLNPSGSFTVLFPNAADLTFTADDKGKIFYFADQERCAAGMKIQVSVLDGMIVFLPWTEHVERFEKDGYLQTIYDKGLTIKARDQVWFVTATYEHNVYRVSRKEMWEGDCKALGGLKVNSTEKQLDVSSARMLYYPSNKPNARHLWVLKGGDVLTVPGEEAYLGCFNVYHECDWFKNSSVFLPPCAVTHCNMGPAGGQRILIRRAADDIVTTSGASFAAPFGLGLPILALSALQLLLAAGLQ